MKSKCLSCERFWKTQDDKEKRCYRGGSDGGLIHYCTGYKRKEGMPMSENYIERILAEEADEEKVREAIEKYLKGVD